MNKLLLILFLATVSQSATDGVLDVSHRARTLQPGEVVLLDVSGDKTLNAVEVKAFGRRFLLSPTTSSNWQGLVGIDLDTEPGLYPLQIEARTANRTLQTEYVLKITGKEFPTRRLNVDPRFVTPPPEVSERIARESKRLQTVLSNVGTAKLWSGSLARPVPGAASSSFGKRSVFNGKPRSPHTGADFRAEAGTPVAAPAAGRITLADDLYYAGQSVVIDHGHGLISMLIHMSRIDVEEGVMVERGDQVGLVGATGRVTGPHLHWAMRLSGARVDPLSLMELMSAGF